MNDNRLAVDPLVCNVFPLPAMNIFGWHVLQLWQPLLNKPAVRVVSFTLKFRVKDAKVRLWISSRRRCPLPSTVVLSRVVVHQQVSEMLLAQLPVDKQVLGEVARHYHSKTVVHYSGGRETAHCSIHDWSSGFALFPSFEELEIILPLQVTVLLLEAFESAIHDADVVVEITPV